MAETFFSPDPKYRTFWPRFWASLIDGLVLIPFGILGAFISGVAGMSKPVLAIWCVFWSLLPYFYSIYFHGQFGQTFGKMFCKIMIMDASERDMIGFRRAFYRDSVPLFLTLIFLPKEVIEILSNSENVANGHSLAEMFLMYISLSWFILELVTMLLNYRRRALHDFIAGTVVIRI